MVVSEAVVAAQRLGNADGASVGGTQAGTDTGAALKLTAGDNINGAADGVVTDQTAAGIGAGLQDFDSFNLVEGNGVQIVVAILAVIHRNAVNQQTRLTGTGTTNRHQCRITEATQGLHLHAVDLLQKVTEVAEPPVQFVVVKYLKIGCGLLFLYCGDQNLFHVVAIISPGWKMDAQETDQCWPLQEMSA
jgi:hypothetical protein